MARRRREGENPARSVRVDNITWAQAVCRAENDSTTISEVIQLFVKGYAAGLINPPKVQVVYSGTGAMAGQATTVGSVEPPR